MCTSIPNQGEANVPITCDLNYSHIAQLLKKSWYLLNVFTSVGGVAISANQHEARVGIVLQNNLKTTKLSDIIVMVRN